MQNSCGIVGGDINPYLFRCCFPAQRINGWRNFIQNQKIFTPFSSDVPGIADLRYRNLADGMAPFPCSWITGSVGRLRFSSLFIDRADGIQTDWISHGGGSVAGSDSFHHQESGNRCSYLWRVFSLHPVKSNNVIYQPIFFISMLLFIARNQVDWKLLREAGNPHIQ